jgi:GT2 family glycosyltransferase
MNMIGSDMFQFEPARVEAGSTPVPSSDAMPLADKPAGERTAVIISTRGRPDIVSALVEQLAGQTRAPEHIFVIGSSAADIARLNPGQPDVTAQVGREGSSSQRNDGLALAGSRFAYIVFFDDDFVPSRFWIERMEAVFRSDPDIVGLTGTVLADGTTTAGIGLEEACSMVEASDADSRPADGVRYNPPYGGNMGCNMAFRASALGGMTFDERLPLYAWLEDADFRSRIETRGQVVRADGLRGVHLGHKQGRGRGVTIGYSQIANAIYLARKGTVPKTHLVKLATRNVIANLVRSIRPEPFIDRRGRLLGNVLALVDFVRGRVAPERILEL